MHRQTSHVLQGSNKNHPWTHSQVCSVLQSFWFETLGAESHTQRGACITTAFGIQWSAKENLQWKFAQVYKATVTSVPPLSIHQERDWARIFRISSIRQEFKPQVSLQSWGMLLANPGLEEFSFCPPKASLGLIECPRPGDLLLLLFQTMSLDIYWASRQPVILTPISRLLEQTPFDLRPFAFS